MNYFDWIWKNIEKISGFAVLFMSAYTLYLTHFSNTVKALKITASMSLFGGQSLSVLLVNTTLHPIGLTNVYLLFRRKNICYCFCVKEYDIPLTLKPWESVLVVSNEFSSDFGGVFDEGSLLSVINDCCVIITNNEGNIVWTSGIGFKKKLWYRCYVLWNERNCFAPILITERYFETIISKNCQFGVNVIDAVNTEATKEYHLIVMKNGFIYNGEQKIGEIELLNNEDLDMENIKHYIVERFDICENCISVSKLAKGCDGYSTTITQKHISFW